MPPGTRTFTWLKPGNPGAFPKNKISANRPPMATCGGITLPSLRLVVYIDKASPATAGCSDEAICPVSECQMAPWPPLSPESENNIGAGDKTAGRKSSAVAIVNPQQTQPP